jgi:hypothetical protein
MPDFDKLDQALQKELASSSAGLLQAGATIARGKATLGRRSAAVWPIPAENDKAVTISCYENGVDLARVTTASIAAATRVAQVWLEQLPNTQTLAQAFADVKMVVVTF